MNDDLLQRPNDVKEYKFNLNDLNISQTYFIRSLGYSESNIPGQVAESVIISSDILIKK